ncbi:MAG: hypothetical protein KDA93_22265 [Planctomycetaceae bacterium]|nr:hypothetical protein [Planctomycetaceae bacterium]
MSERSQKLWLVAVMSLTAFGGWTAWQWKQSRDELRFATEQWREVDTLARKIEELRDAPAKYEETLRTNEALAELVENSARLTKLPTDRIVQIAPSEPRRVGDSPYKEQLTELELREITLQQLVELTLAILQADPGVSVSTLSLRVPPGNREAAADEQTDEFWNVQLHLTSQFYAPILAAPP